MYRKSNSIVRNANAVTQNRVLFLLTLSTMWVIYVLSRAAGGLELISDEYFYMYEDVNSQYKRRIFTYLVQYFGNFETAWLMTTSLNISAVLVSFVILSRIYFNNNLVTFAQLLYFPAIASFVFRDSLIILLIVALTAVAFSRDRKLLIYASPLILILYDFRPHFAAFFVASLMAAYFIERVKSNTVIVALVAIASVSALSMAALIGDSFNVYGITLSEYLQSRSDRYEQSYSPTNTILAFIRHYFAPIPTSLLERIAYGGEAGISVESQYGALDDAYRMLYKSVFYFVFAYLLIRWKLVVQVIDRWRFESGFLIAFSLANAMLYTAFNFGGGHERVKVVSTFFLFYLFAGVIHLRRERKSLSYTSQ